MFSRLHTPERKIGSFVRPEQRFLAARCHTTNHYNGTGLFVSVSSRELIRAILDFKYFKCSDLHFGSIGWNAIVGPVWD
jgi:hypothetical protein